METPNGLSEIKALFGNPVGPNGGLDPAFENHNIISYEPPANWRLFFQGNRQIIPRNPRIHRLLAPSLTGVLNDVWDFAKEQLGAAATEEEVRNWLHEKRLDLHGGGFHFRNKRDSASISLHSFGIAIDWDPNHNPQQRPLTKTLPDWWYSVWADHGWTYGRRFRPEPDPMHVQFAKGV